MLRRALILLGVLGALLALDRGQRDAAADRRQEALRVRRFVDESAVTGHPVAIVRVADPDGHAVLYGRVQGQWHCLSYHGAPALDEKIDQLVNMIEDTRGVVLSEQPARPQDYGLDVPTMRVISLHGPAMNVQDPASDRLAAIDVGAAVTGAEGCYARVHGQAAIWTIDGDPASITGREASPRPSLIDPSLVPASWPGASPRLKSIRVAQVGQDEFTLDLREKQITPEQAEQGFPGYDWILKAGGRESASPINIAMGYASFLMSSTWTEVVDPALAAKLGFDQPRAVVTLTGGGPVPLRLALGGRTASGRSAVLVDVSHTVFEIDPAQEALLFPRAAQFAADATANPWDPKAPGK